MSFIETQAVIEICRRQCPNIGNIIASSCKCMNARIIVLFISIVSGSAIWTRYDSGNEAVTSPHPIPNPDEVTDFSITNYDSSFDPATKTSTPKIEVLKITSEDDIKICLDFLRNHEGVVQEARPIRTVRLFTFYDKKRGWRHAGYDIFLGKGRIRTMMHIDGVQVFKKVEMNGAFEIKEFDAIHEVIDRASDVPRQRFEEWRGDLEK